MSYFLMLSVQNPVYISHLQHSSTQIYVKTVCKTSTTAQLRLQLSTVYWVTLASNTALSSLPNEPNCTHSLLLETQSERPPEASALPASTLLPEPGEPLPLLPLEWWFKGHLGEGHLYISQRTSILGYTAYCLPIFTMITQYFTVEKYLGTALNPDCFLFFINSPLLE